MLWLIIPSFLFYSLNMTGFKIKDFILVDGSCIKGEPQDIPFWIVYAVSVCLFIFAQDIGRWVLLGFFILGAFTMTMTTIRFIIFPNDKKTKAYNEYFKTSHHIIKPSTKRLIPDTWHLGLLFLVFLNLISLLVYNLTR